MKRKGIPNVPLIDQFFYTLVKLKHNVKFEYLADQIGIPETTVIDYVWKWINNSHTKLQYMIQWPDRDHIFSTMPPAMKSLYPRLTAIIDCFEMFIETPSNHRAHAQCWSNYKKTYHCQIPDCL